MSFSDRFVSVFKSVLPSPFSIAVILSFLTFTFALLFTKNATERNHVIVLLDYWQNGLWDQGLLVFAVQMMLMLVLGHTLALTPMFSKVTDLIVTRCNSTAISAFYVSLATLIVSFFNWGLGLIFGAILVRKVGEYAQKNNIPLNYPLIGASGYAGLMVWHGGLSGSAPLKVAESGHFLEPVIGIVTQSETLFSILNIFTSILLLTLIPVFLFLIGKVSSTDSNTLLPIKQVANGYTIKPKGAEAIDHSRVISLFFGGIILFVVLRDLFFSSDGVSFNVITPNLINLTLFGLCILFHKHFAFFLKAVDQAIVGASGILIQFPLYFGIMGIMKSSGLINVLSDFFVSISNETTFPVFTFLSAGIVNIFVPSGGGQWAVQGPIIADAATKLGSPIGKCIMALAYGDQLTNMMQPFWALPLLGITGLKAKEILPYSLMVMGIGGVIFLTALLLF